MKFDLDCVRDLMLTLENMITLNDDLVCEEKSFDEIAKSKAMEKYDRKEVFYVAQKLKEAGFIDFYTFYADSSVSEACFGNITYAGHQFLESIRSTEIWQKTKSAAEKIGSFSIKMIFELAVRIGAAALNNYLGINM